MGLRDFFKIDNTPPGTKRRAEAAAKKKRNKGRVGGDNEAAMAADKAARAAIVKKARPMFKIDNTPPGTKRRAEAEAKKKSAVAKKSVMAKKIAARNAKEKARQGEAIAKTAVSRPSRPAISMANAADSKTKRPATPAKPPTSRVKPLSAGKQNITSTVTRPTTNPTVKPAEVGKTSLTKKPQVTGLDRRNVTSDGPSGKRKRANVTREQMEKVGLDPSKKSDLTKYLNKFDKLKRRPRKSDFSTLLSPVPVISEVKNRVSEARNPMSKRESKFNRGGMAMKTKMGTKGGAMGGAKGYSEGREVKADKAAKAKAAKEKAAKARRRLMPGLTTRKAPRIKGISKNMSPTSTFSKGRSVSGKLPMVEKNGKMIPAYAADGKGKMMAGGKVKSKGMAKGGMMKSKGMAKGGAMKTKGYSKGGAMKTKGYKKGGKVRGAGIARKGVRPAKML